MQGWIVIDDYDHLARWEGLFEHRIHRSVQIFPALLGVCTDNDRNVSHVYLYVLDVCWNCLRLNVTWIWPDSLAPNPPLLIYRSTDYAWQRVQFSKGGNQRTPRYYAVPL